ncbi:MAG: L,D-transpeptidase family protein [Rhodobiaceae bacterium]|nr:L,D-transpeptidase family protein [Rhodobiaceae bacterium]
MLRFSIVFTVVACTLSPASAFAWQGKAEFEAALADWQHKAGPVHGQQIGHAIHEMYAARDYAPLWTIIPEREKIAVDVIRVLESADSAGLDPRDYQVASPDSPQSWIDFELGMSAAFVRYAADQQSGRVDPEVVDDDQSYEPPALKIPALLTVMANSSNPALLLRSLVPPHPAYDDLVQILADLRRSHANGGWPSPEIISRKLEMGMQGDEVDSLRRYLVSTGDLAVDDAALTRPYDASLKQAVQRFQTRHGLDRDGIVGPVTKAAMAVSVDTRMAQVVANMERWRWMPQQLGEKHIVVNAADFSLTLVEEGEVVDTFPVIVGQPFHRTPMFSREMTYLVLNPYWNVPYSIASSEILAKQQQDPLYLEAHNFEVLDREERVVDPAGVDWNAIRSDQFPFHVRQKPGGGNALGQIKFMLPNKYSVYLHDTPAKSLFSRARRAFSHGCVRVFDPLRLAGRVLKGKGWTRADLLDQMARHENKTVWLPRPIPVHLVYFTVWKDKSGMVQFRDDIYGRDRKLLAALASRAR